MPQAGSGCVQISGHRWGVSRFLDTGGVAQRAQQENTRTRVKYAGRKTCTRVSTEHALSYMRVLVIPLKMQSRESHPVDYLALFEDSLPVTRSFFVARRP